MDVIDRNCWILLLLLAGAGACAGPLKRPAQGPLPPAESEREASPKATPLPTEGTVGGVIELEPMRIEVVRDDSGREVVVGIDARTLFDLGNEALVEGRTDEALAHYRQLVRDFSDSKLLSPTLYNVGLAHEARGEAERAVEAYLELVNRVPRGRDSIDGHLRAAAVLSEHRLWSRALSVLGDVLARPDLTDSDRLEGMVRRGYVQLEEGRLVEAESALREAIGFYEDRVAEDSGHFESRFFVAMAHFYLGEIPRRQFAAIPIRLPDEQIKKDVENKAELVLLAGERFSDAIAVGNVHWATAAGYQLGAMQRDFWTALVVAPIPPHLGEQAAALYVEEVHKQALGLLEKAVDIHSKNIRLAEAYKTSTSWSDASKGQLAELTELIAREKGGQLVSPSPDDTARTSAPRAGGEFVPGRRSL